MASRMDRYHSSTNETAKRSRRNEKLYDTIYSDDIEYSNVEGIAKIEKTNEIDLDRIKEMLRKEEEKKKTKRFQPIFKRNISFPETVFDDDKKEDRNYDIRDILSQAKKDKSEEENDKYRNLKNTQYNILKNIKLDDDIVNKSHKEIEESEQLKELIHTITNTSLLNKINDKDLSLDLLDDLKSDNSNTTTVNKTSIKQILEEEKEKRNSSVVDEDSRDYDKSFFTSSLNFSDDDFEELKEISTTYHRNNRLIKILIFIIVVAVIVMIVLFFMNMPK